MELDDGTTIEARNVIRELNVAMTWLSYPGRTNGTATAEAVTSPRRAAGPNERAAVCDRRRRPGRPAQREPPSAPRRLHRARTSEPPPRFQENVPC